MGKGLTRQRLLAVFITAVVLLNYPLVALFDGPALVASLPPVFLYLFAVWGGMIVLVGLIVELSRERGRRG